MAKLIYSARAFLDLERLVDFLVEVDALVAAETVGLIEEAIVLLARHPLIGRPVENGLREISISCGKSDCVALYSFEEQQNAALILTIRHYRESRDRNSVLLIFQ